MAKKLNNRMLRKTLLLAGVGALLFVQVQLFAAKGEAKSKKGYVLKFNGFELRGITNTFFTLKPGAVYKGSFNNVEKAPQQVTLQSIITYQQGNTTFIYPYRHKVTVPNQKFKTPEKPKF